MRKINLQNTSAQGKETIKENNQTLILNLIREQQPISRVEISEQTKLQRSTVTVITTRRCPSSLKVTRSHRASPTCFQACSVPNAPGVTHSGFATAARTDSSAMP